MIHVKLHPEVKTKLSWKEDLNQESQNERVNYKIGINESCIQKQWSIILMIGEEIYLLSFCPRLNYLKLNDIKI